MSLNHLNLTVPDIAATRLEQVLEIAPSPL